ncbi:MAG: YkgJ family cysteine cluster protein [Thermodesulfobacteriota bacterium]
MIDRLNDIYELYDRIIGSTALACGPGCAGCCTCNVILTSLEARMITDRLASPRREILHAAITHGFPVKRYIPKMSTNRFARLCMEDADLPEEENDPAWGKCPLLENDLCTIYDVRPFGCRAMVSESYCRDTGSAQMPSWVLTVNNLFLQAIEHLDQDGYFGNLSDMLLLTLSENAVTGQEHQNHGRKNRGLFVKNEPINCLMIPPEHRAQMAPVVRNLSQLINTGPDTGHGNRG